MKKKLALVLVFLMIFTNLFGFAGAVDPAAVGGAPKPLPQHDITLFIGDLDATVDLYKAGGTVALATGMPDEDGNVLFSQTDGTYYYILNITPGEQDVIYPLMTPSEDGVMHYEFNEFTVGGDDVLLYPVHELTVSGNYQDLDGKYDMYVNDGSGKQPLDPTKTNYLLAGEFEAGITQYFETKMGDTSITEEGHTVFYDINTTSLKMDAEGKPILTHDVAFNAYTVSIPWLNGDINRNFALFKNYDKTLSQFDFKNDNDIKQKDDFLVLKKTNVTKPNGLIAYNLLAGDYAVWFAPIDDKEISAYPILDLNKSIELKSHLVLEADGLMGVDIELETKGNPSVEAEANENTPYDFSLSHSKYVMTLVKGGLTKVIDNVVVGGAEEKVVAPVVNVTFNFGEHMKGTTLMIQSLVGDDTYAAFDTYAQLDQTSMTVPVFDQSKYRYIVEKDGVQVSDAFAITNEDLTIDLTKHFAKVTLNFPGIDQAKVKLVNTQTTTAGAVDVVIYKDLTFEDTTTAWVLNANTYAPSIIHGGVEFFYDEILLSASDLEYTLDALIANVTVSFEGIEDVDVLVKSDDALILESFYAKSQADNKVSFNVIPTALNADGTKDWLYLVSLKKNDVVYTFTIDPEGGVQVWDNLTRQVGVTFSEFEQRPVSAEIVVGDKVFARSTEIQSGSIVFRVFREFNYFVNLSAGEQKKQTAETGLIPADDSKSDSKLTAIQLGDYSGMIHLNHVGAAFDKIELLDVNSKVLETITPVGDDTNIPVFKDLDYQVRLTKGAETKVFSVRSTDGLVEYYVGYAELFYKNEGMNGANFRHSFDNGTTWSPVVKTVNGYAFYAINASELKLVEGQRNTTVKFRLNLNNTIIDKAYDLTKTSVINEVVYKLSAQLLEGTSPVQDEKATLLYFKGTNATSFNTGNLKTGKHELYVLSGKYTAELSYRDGVNQLTGNKNEDTAFNFKLIPVTVRVNGANGFDSVKYYKNTDKLHTLAFGSDTDASSTMGLLADTYDFSVAYATSNFFSPGFAVTETNNLVEFDVKDLTVNFTDSKGNPITEGTVILHSLSADGLINSDGVSYGTFTPENQGVITKALEQGKTYQFTLLYQNQEMIIQKAFPLDVPTDEAGSIQSLSAASTAPFITFTTMDYRVKFEDSKHKPYVGVEVVVQNKAMMEATTADVAAPFPKKAMTDAQGIAHFELLQGGYDVILSYEGGVQTKTERLSRNVFLGRQTITPIAPCDMLFQTIEATVAFNESTGAPIKDAPVYQIQMRLPMPGTPMMRDDVDLEVVEKVFVDDDMITLVGKTGADGKLLLERLPQNTYMMSVERYEVLSYEKQLHVIQPTDFVLEGMDGLATILPIDITPINTVKFSTLPVVVEVYGSVLSSGAPIQDAKVEFATSRLLKKKEMKEVSVTEAPVTEAPLPVFYTGQNTNAEGKTYLELLPNNRAFGYMVKVTYNGTWDMDRLALREALPPRGLLFADGPVPPTPGRMNTITFRTTGIEVISKYTDNVGISGTQITVTDAKVPVGTTVNGRKIVEVFMPFLDKAPVDDKQSMMALEDEALMPSMMIYATQAGVEKSLAYDFPEVQQAVFTFNRPVVDTNDNERPARVTTETIIDVPAPLGPIQFIDVPGHWAEKEINALAELGYVKGKTPTMFYPNAPITRAEFGSILARILKLTGTKQTHFVDVPGNAWFFDSIASAYEFGVVKGISPTQYGPYLNITRQDIALMVVRAYSLKTGKTMEASVNELFKDDPQIGSYAKEAVYQAKGTSIVGGYPDGNFRPQGNATRAEAAKMLKILMDAIAGK